MRSRNGTWRSSGAWTRTCPAAGISWSPETSSGWIPPTSRSWTAELPAAEALTPHQLIVILRTLVFSLRLLHDKQVVHGDIKPDNVLVQRGGEDLLISKLIDFDEAYVAGQPPVSAQIVGDPGYYSPELLRYIKQDPATPSTCLGLPSDMFSLGLLLHSFLGREIPLFDRTLANYPAEAVLAGIPFDLGGAPPALRPILAGLLAPDPEARPDITAVIDFLAAVDPEALLPARPGTAASAPMTIMATSTASARLSDPATTRASGEWPARVRPASPPDGVRPPAASDPTPVASPMSSPSSTSSGSAPAAGPKPASLPPTTSPTGSAGAPGTTGTAADATGRLRISMGRRKRPETPPAD